MDESKDNPAAYENDAELRLLSEQVDPGITRATMETFQRRSTRKRKQPDRFTPDAEQGSLSKINGEAVDELESSTQDSLSIDPEDSNVLATPPESAEDDSPTRGPSGKKTKPPKRRKSKKPKVGDSSQRGQQQSDDSNPLHSDRGMKFRDADRECQLTSEDLTQAALQAQATNAVNPDFETSSLRLINGKWMIPVACSR
ncbi:MAG: hypothetical protein M4579_005352 [Chaenotheca gracillima]|nr:MAG: hypothetical protein M4579_005352 [Chaenotheca gracillima]